MKDYVIAQDETDGWLLFVDPVLFLGAHSIGDVAGVLEKASKAVADGLSIAGFMTYEAASGIDPVMVTRESDGRFPLVWFGAYRDVVRLKALPEADPTADFHLGEWVCDTLQADYDEAISRIKHYIYAGDTYQVNYTVRLRSRFAGSSYALFRKLVKAQRARYAVYIETEDLAICSASPELFFERNGSRIVSRPMKGTAARGLTYAEDCRVAHALQTSAKNCAENVMIVDMIRNDLGKIAVPGSVYPSRLFEVEQYPTLHQMVSTVTADIPLDTDLQKIAGALFPCASITGAPKVRTMQIIREVEHSPRGVYTGMCGYWLAGGEARFNVAIRTVVVDRKKGTAEYGTGGGIVWDSTSAGEYMECFTKAQILTRPTVNEFQILETLLYEPESGWFLLEEHLRRASQSAAYFGFKFSESGMRKSLDACVNMKADQAHALKVRWLLAADGRMHSEASVLAPSDERWSVACALNACRHDDVFLYHKTTNRQVYDDALKRFPTYRDVVLVNELGLVTESCYANVVLDLGDEKVTPPLSCGLLNGTFRQHLLDQSLIREAPVTVKMLRSAKQVWLINSVRKWIPACLA